VIVTQDGLGMTTHRPRFVPDLGDLATKMKEAFSSYVERIATGEYPAAEHQYQMPADEKAKFLAGSEF
jgi:3-methyl-2-oxobutanoate hydroxymethyltransferase